MLNVKVAFCGFNYIIIQYMKNTISILGRKCDVLILLVICALSVFITVNTVCNCTKCNNEGSCKKKGCQKKVRFAPGVKGHSDGVYNQLNSF